MSIKKTKLRDYFPMIMTREKVLEAIEANESISKTFHSLSIERQEIFLDIFSGSKGLKMMYDTFFKEALNADATPERLSDFLSIVLNREVTVISALPNDSNRLGDEQSLVITDIVVRLDDGSIANVEVQKIGYKFLGQRASCYSADLLLREYKRVRSEKGQSFTYKDVAPVYTIVLLEKSPEEFWKYPDVYIHRITAKSDSGIDVGMLQNFYFIPVDIFLRKLHNEGINSKFDAWLTFLGCDEPEWIMKLIDEYAQFEDYYKTVYNMCLNIEGVMNMFSEELAILDRNTEKLMWDEMQEELDSKNEELASVKTQLDTAKTELDTAKTELDTAKTELDTAKTELDTVITENEVLKKLLKDNGIDIPDNKNSKN